jgi:hypothetical protein
LEHPDGSIAACAHDRKWHTCPFDGSAAFPVSLWGEADIVWRILALRQKISVFGLCAPFEKQSKKIKEIKKCGICHMHRAAMMDWIRTSRTPQRAT